MASLVNSTNILKRINANSSHTLPKKKKKEEGTHPNSFYEANITLRAKPEKHATHTHTHTRKSITGNIGTKTLYLKTTTNLIEQHTERVIYYDLRIPEIQGCSNIQK